MPSASKPFRLLLTDDDRRLLAALQAHTGAISIAATMRQCWRAYALQALGKVKMRALALNSNQDQPQGDRTQAQPIQEPQ